jgi:Rha family phage regulatory protein
VSDLRIISKDGQLVTDSREVADMVGKRHSDLLQSIEGYIKHLLNGNFRSVDFFIESTYKDSTGRELPCYLLTRKGCDMVANKMTGEKGVLFTAAYVTKFEEMEKQVQAPQKQLSAMEQLRLQYQVIEEHDRKIYGVAKKVDDLQANMPLFNVECKELQALVKRTGTKALGGYKSPAYNDNSLRGRVYSDIQQQLRREFGVERYEAIKRCQLNTARKIVEEYKAPMILLDEIYLANSQVEFGGN